MTTLSPSFLNTIPSLKRENLAVPLAILSPFRLILCGITLACKGLAVFLIVTTALIACQEFQTSKSPSVLPTRIGSLRSALAPGNESMRPQHLRHIPPQTLSMAQQRSTRLIKTILSTRNR